MDTDQPVWAGITEGRIVHVRTPGVDHCRAAIIVRAWGGDVVNVVIFRDGSNDHEAPGFGSYEGQGSLVSWQTSVGHESQAINGNQSWHWPERA